MILPAACGPIRHPGFSGPNPRSLFCLILNFAAHPPPPELLRHLEHLSRHLFCGSLLHPHPFPSNFGPHLQPDFLHICPESREVTRRLASTRDRQLPIPCLASVPYKCPFSKFPGISSTSSQYSRQGQRALFQKISHNLTCLNPISAPTL